MKHYISICTERGPYAKQAIKVPLSECLTALFRPQNTRESKEENFLLFPAYSTREEKYDRNESQVDRFSVIVLDCDNDQKDPMVIDKFKEQMVKYDYLIYETSSSTVERPKFRAIIPLDDELPWNKIYKSAVLQRFRVVADFRATWFYSPNTSKVNTVFENCTGREFPASVIRQDATLIEESERNKERKRELSIAMMKLADPDGLKRDWRRLKQVKKCLNGLVEGERDASLNSACFTMWKCGYQVHIKEFLDMVDVPMSVKSKFYKRKYR